MKKAFLLVFCACVMGCQRDAGTDDSRTAVENLFQKALNDTENRALYLQKIQSTLAVQPSDSTGRSYYLRLAWYYLSTGNREQFRKTSFDVYKQAVATGDYHTTAIAAHNIAVYHYDKAEYEEAYLFYTKAEKAASQLPAYPQLSALIIGKANILTFKKDYAGAESAAIDALRIARKFDDSRMLYECFVTLGNSLMGMKNYDKALEYYLKALEVTESPAQPGQKIILRAQVYNYLAQVYQKTEDHRNAIKYAETALGWDEVKRENIRLYSYLLNNLAYSKFKVGHQNVLPIFLSVQKISDSIQIPLTQVSVRLKLAEYFEQKGNLNAAIDYAKSAAQIAKQYDVFEDELQALQQLARLVPGSASAYNERYINLSDSLQHVERATRNKFARMEFETDEIVSQKRIIEEERDKMSAQRWVILGFGFLLLIVIILIFINKTQRARNRELEYTRNQLKSKEEIYRLMLEQHEKVEEGKQSEKRRISQELHDGVLGRLSSIRLNLFVLSKRSDAGTIANCLLHIDEIQTVEKEIRAIAHDLRRNILSDTNDFTTIVESLFATVRDHSNISFQLEVDEKIEWHRIGSHIKLQVFRILQEALQNIDKHSGATMVSLAMKQVESQLVVTVIDNGKGFDYNVAGKGIGLINMKSRAEEIGAKFSVVSRIGEGTEVSLHIPSILLFSTEPET